MKISLDPILCKLTGRTWNFQATFCYTMNPGQPNSGNVTSARTFYVRDRNILGYHRKLKKIIAGDMVANLDKVYRRNGVLEIQSISYVGWFKPPVASKPKTGKLGHKPKWWLR